MASYHIEIILVFCVLIGFFVGMPFVCHCRRIER